MPSSRRCRNSIVDDKDEDEDEEDEEDDDVEDTSLCTGEDGCPSLGANVSSFSSSSSENCKVAAAPAVTTRFLGSTSTRSPLRSRCGRTRTPVIVAGVAVTSAGAGDLGRFAASTRGPGKSECCCYSYDYHCAILKVALQREYCNA